MPAVRKLTALGLFISVTHVLDKTNAASFTVTHFNYYANDQQLKLLADLYDLFETTQKLSDDLGPFVKRFPYTTTSTPALDPVTQQMPLPSDYEHALRCKSTYRVKEAFGAYRKGEQVERSPKRLTADQQDYVEQPNHYLKPTFDRPYRRTLGGYLEILSGIHSRMTMEKNTLEYLKRPDEVVLYEADTTDLTVDNSQVLEWPASVTYRLAQYIAAAFMEFIGSGRLANYAAMNRGNTGAAPAPAQSNQRGQRAAAADEQAGAQG